jgi:hypothetical protein
VRPAERILVAFSAGCAAAVIGYAAVRCAEAALFPEVNPATVIGAVQSPFAWRCLIAAYLGGLGGLGSYGLARRSPDVAARWLVRGVVAAVAGIAAQGALVP